MHGLSQQREGFYEALRDRILAAARFHYGLSAVDQESGVTLRVLYEGLLQKAKKPERIAELEAKLHGPAVPKSLEYLWGWFQELDASRASSGFGPLPITFQEMKAWADLTRVRPTPWEVNMLKAIDIIRLVAAAGEEERGGDNEQ